MSIATATAARTTWKIDSTHSHAEFAVRHLMISTVKGRFGVINGTVNLDEGDVTKSDVDITIDVNSIHTHEAQRDAHLKSADFFDVEHFPAITFKSTRIAGDSSAFKVTGDLTIHGIQRAHQDQAQRLRADLESAPRGRRLRGRGRREDRPGRGGGQEFVVRSS
jgi:polyisoprenoid-binding protein YceI